MSELELSTYGGTGNYSDLAPVKPEVEYAFSPETEATQLLKIYGQGALEFLSADAADGETVSRLSDDIALLRAQNPHDELKPFFTVNFSDRLTPDDLYERFRSLSEDPNTSLFVFKSPPSWSNYSSEELNRRTASGVEPAHLSLRGMILRRQKDGRLPYPAIDYANDNGCHHVLASKFSRYRFEHRTPGRTLMNLTDLLMVSTIWLNTNDSILKPDSDRSGTTYGKLWDHRSPFLGFRITGPRPMVGVTGYSDQRGGDIRFSQEFKTNTGSNSITTMRSKVPFYDSVGITLR